MESKVDLSVFTGSPAAVTGDHDISLTGNANTFCMSRLCSSYSMRSIPNRLSWVVIFINFMCDEFSLVYGVKLVNIFRLFKGAWNGTFLITNVVPMNWSKWFMPFPPTFSKPSAIDSRIITPKSRLGNVFDSAMSAKKKKKKMVKIRLIKLKIDCITFCTFLTESYL